MKVSGIPFIQGRNAYHDSDGRKFAIAIHNTSNDASAADEAQNATHRTDGVSSHFYCDGHAVIQSLDTVSRAGHAGSSQGNENAVAVEIAGTNDKSRQWWLDNVAWDLLGRVLRDVCVAYGIVVRRVPVAEMQRDAHANGFYSHNDMRLAWGGTTHDDPGPNFPWDKLFAAVSGDDEEDSMGASFGPTLVPEGTDFMPLCIPPVAAGLADPRKTWLNLGGDFNAGNAVALRIFLSDGGGGWFALPGYADGIAVVLSGHVLSVELPQGTRLLSISRWGLDASGKPTDPRAPGAHVPGFPFSVCFERA